jgi:hypothetical protein
MCKLLILTTLVVLCALFSKKIEEKFRTDLWGNWIEYAAKVHGKKIKIRP